MSLLTQVNALAVKFEMQTGRRPTRLRGRIETLRNLTLEVQEQCRWPSSDSLSSLSKVLGMDIVACTICPPDMLYVDEGPYSE